MAEINTLCQDDDRFETAPGGADRCVQIGPPARRT